MVGRFSLIILACLFVNCVGNEQTKESVFVVKVPPLYNDQLSKEENYWRFRHFLFPQEMIPNPLGEGLPNDDSLLHISISESGKIKLNSENVGDVYRTDLLKDRLIIIFKQRKKEGVYENNNLKVVKAVGIKSDSSIKYGDFMNVVETVFQSNAEPIVLLFDNDARPKAILDHSNTKERKKLIN